MRRMLDPKTIGGGGSTSTPMHGYSVIIRNQLHYEVYTEKDYDLKLREVTSISDFSTNPNYQELHSKGTYPATGYYYKSDNDQVIGDKVIVTEIQSGGFNLPNYTIVGYNPVTKQYVTIQASSSPSISVIKNF